MLTGRQVIELFHLVFLRALTTKGEDKRLVAVKGGCNLRFYFASVRYSEDIDFDVTVIGKDTLTHRVDRLLRSAAVTSPLQPSQAESTGSADAWNAMQQAVITRLEELGPTGRA